MSVQTRFEAPQPLQSVLLSVLEWSGVKHRPVATPKSCNLLAHRAETWPAGRRKGSDSRRGGGFSAKSCLVML